MLKSQSFFTDSFWDMELKIPRTAPLEYRVSYDDGKKLKAIVFLIGGLGANANMSLFDLEREVVAREFPVLCVQVLYHCFCARPSITQGYNPKLQMQEIDRESLQKVAQICGVENQNAKDFAPQLKSIDAALEGLKARGELERDFRAVFSCDLYPTRNEYQNYALLPALDHIAALKDLIKRPEFQNLAVEGGGGVASLPRIFGGGSYGGYVAMLCAKIAPPLVDGVLDNSGVVLPFLPHILGREMGTGEFAIAGKHYDLLCYVRKFWTRDEASPYYFSEANYRIRTLLNAEHLKILAQNSRTLFVHYHSAFDEGAPAAQKIALSENLNALGLSSTLHLIKSKEDLDGRTLKSLEHGLRMSDKALMRRELGQMLERLAGWEGFNGDFELGYPCGDRTFTFYDRGGEFGLEISKNDL